MKGLGKPRQPSPRSPQARHPQLYWLWGLPGLVLAGVVTASVLWLGLPWSAQSLSGASAAQADVPESCPGPRRVSFANTPSVAAQSRLLVIARKADDTSWADIYLSIPHLVYQHPEVAVRQQATFLAPVIKGEEAALYLQFIIDHYAAEALPNVTVFTKGAL